MEDIILSLLYSHSSYKSAATLKTLRPPAPDGAVGGRLYGGSIHYGVVSRGHTRIQQMEHAEEAKTEVRSIKISEW